MRPSGLGLASAVCLNNTDWALQIDSFDVFTAAELVSEVGECAAIVERNFNSKSFHEQPHMLVPVYTILEGVLRIIPKFLRRPSPRTRKLTRAGTETGC